MVSPVSSLPHASMHKLYWDIQALCRLFRSHAAFQEAAADGFHVFPHLDDMAVGIVKTHHPLSPGMFLHRMHIFDAAFLQPLCKLIELIFFKINFRFMSEVPFRFFVYLHHTLSFSLCKVYFRFVSAAMVQVFCFPRLIFRDFCFNMGL